jgi:hypothetical protein
LIKLKFGRRLHRQVARLLALCGDDHSRRQADETSARNNIAVITVIRPR